MKKQLIALANVARSFEKSGNLEAGRLINLAMKKIAQYEDDDYDDYDDIRDEKFCSYCGDRLSVDDLCDWCDKIDDGMGNGELINEREEEAHQYDQDEDDLIDGVGFADPGGRSSLRAETSSNPRIYPCPTCGTPNTLTKIDKSRGYQCDRCADRAEGRGGYGEY